MRTCDIVKLLKATGFGALTGLVTTTSVLGAEVLGMTPANAFSSIPTDDDQCIATLLAQRQLDSKILLWSLLAFAPGLVLGTLYFLSKQINFCNSNASEYEQIEDDNQGESSENPLPQMGKEILAKLAIALSAVGLVFGTVKIIVNGVNKEAYTPNCHGAAREVAVMELIVSLMMFGMLFGTLYCCTSSSRPKEAQTTPAQLESGHTAILTRPIKPVPVVRTATAATDAELRHVSFASVATLKQ